MSLQIVKTIHAAVPVREQSGAATLVGLEDVFQNVVAVVLGFAGIALFIMLIVGGYKWITAGGDPKGVEEAKKTLTYAIGGLVLIALALLIIRFIHEFTGASVMDFKIFQL